MKFIKLLFIVITALWAVEAAAQWSSDTRLTTSPFWSETSFNNARSLDAEGNNLHVTWHDTRDGNYEIYYKRSTDGGATWGADVRISNDNQYSYRPSIAASGSTIHIVWYDGRIVNNAEIYYRRSTDNGVTWGPETRLTNANLGSSFPSIAVNGNMVHMTWTEYRDVNDEVYYKRSTDGGTTWGSDVRITNNPQTTNSPFILVSGSKVWIVYDDVELGFREVYIRRSFDDGSSWGSQIKISDTDNWVSWFSSAAVQDSTLHVVWIDQSPLMGNHDIFYDRSTDGGTTWGTDVNLSNMDSTSVYPSVVASGNHVHVIWHDNLHDNSEIYYKRSTNKGDSWQDNVRLTNNAGRSEQPFIDYSGEELHVVWWDGRDGNSEIYYKKNPNGNPLAISNLNNEVPAKYTLSQNFPNPFNPVTKIRFGIPGSGSVYLAVYNSIGEEVSILVDMELAPGSYEYTFDGSTLGSGVYFYKLISGEYSETKKMVLVK